MHVPPRFLDHLRINDDSTSLVAGGSRTYRPEMRPNVLVIGPVMLTEATVAAIIAGLEALVYDWTPDVPLPLPGDARTIVIRDVTTLSFAHQEAWLACLTTLRRPVQLIATSSVDVFPLVTQGMFSEGLYYRLNTILLDLPASTLENGSGGRRCDSWPLLPGDAPSKTVAD